MAYAIWQSHSSDRTQREMLKEAANAAFHQKKRVPRILVNIRWLIDCASTLSTHRNDAVHTPVKFAPYGPEIVFVIPDTTSGREQNVDRMEKQPLASIWNKVRGDMLVLATFCEAISGHLYLNGPSGPLPKRPPLLIARAKTQKTRKKSRRRKTPKPRGRAGASRE
jgi:hypothetical protein